MQKLDLSPLRTAAPFLALALGGCEDKSGQAPQPSPTEDIPAQTAKAARTILDEQEPLGPKPECWVDSREEEEQEDTRFTIRLEINRPNEDLRPLDTDDPTMKDPEITALARQFEQEAKRQVEKVRGAGGFCNLPKRFPDQTEMGDDRLGTPLQDIIQRRDEILATRFPGVQMYWSVDLGRAMCEAAQAPTLFMEDLIPRNRWRGLREAIAPLARQFNRLCIAAFEGRSLKTEPLKSDPLAVRRLLVRRGEAIVGALNRDGLSTIERLWRAKCTPQKPSDEALSGEEWSHLLGSHLLMDAVVPPGQYVGGRMVTDMFLEDIRMDERFVNNTRGHSWRCEEGILDGFEDDFSNSDYCGVVRKCVAFSGIQPIQEDGGSWTPGRFEQRHIPARRRRER